MPKSVDMRPQPLSPYAVSKLAAEHYCACWTHVYGLQTIALRYFNVFGPRQDPTSAYAAVIPAFVSRITSCQFSLFGLNFAVGMSRSQSSTNGRFHVVCSW
jgi:nucleoside-diphosphate-sugar epimerase